ncbi:MAG: alpha/beta hydrolase [Deltaproteobacteria bacterium]|nr:alpha/beta hydrolase [Deltaproteobacteria bacterium]
MVRPTADGRANGSAGEPRWLRPPAAVEPADGTDGPAGHGSPADPLGLSECPHATWEAGLSGEEAFYMRQILNIALIVLALSGAAVAAPWELPPGVKTHTVNAYPMAFQERGSGPPIVFVHGALSDYRSWGAQLASPPAGYRVIAVSLRHYYPERWTGKGSDFSTTQHADDLIKFIEQLGAGPVYLVAHSRGGIVAALAAATRPELVSKLVLMEPGFVALARNANLQGQQSILAALRQAQASFERGEIEGGLKAFAERDIPGS